MIRLALLLLSSSFIFNYSMATTQDKQCLQLLNRTLSIGLDLSEVKRGHLIATNETGLVSVLSEQILMIRNLNLEINKYLKSVQSNQLASTQKIKDSKLETDYCKKLAQINKSCTSMISNSVTLKNAFEQASDLLSGVSQLFQHKIT